MKFHIQEESRAAERKRRKRRRLAVTALLLSAAIAVSICFDLFVVPFEYLWVYASVPKLPLRQEGEMRVHFIDVGQGDCTVFEFPDGKTMMIDGGDETESTRQTVLGYGKALGVDTFDYVLLTHPHADHAGGLDDVLNFFGADTVFMPWCVDNHRDGAYADFAVAAERSGAQTRISQLYETVFSDRREYFYYMMILSPFSPKQRSSYYTAANAEDADTQTVNDASAIAYFEYAGRKLLFTGDASRAVEDKLVSDYTETEGVIFELGVQTPWGGETLAPALENVDFLKAGHHGSASSMGEALAALCKPRAVFISCGSGNSYFHPDSSCISTVRKVSPDTEIYRTDELGSIILTIRTDGSYTVSAANFSS